MDHARLCDELERRLRETKGGLRFADYVRQVGAGEEDHLADLIETDGRTRLEMGQDVALTDYLDALPALRSWPDALDAAIDVALRSLAGGHRPTPDAVERLIALHPHLESPIREAAALAEVIWSTGRLRRSAAPRLKRSLPCDFGPALPDGRLRYELRSYLGGGAFGDVYLALDRQLSDEGSEALVAIKVLAPREDDALARHRFVEEATKARRIDHPNVVRVFDRGVTDRGEDYIVYEHVDGGSLDDWAKRHRGASPREIAGLVATIARGLQAAHTAGLIHCDLKPTNIVMTREGEPKIADFGVALRAGAEKKHDAYADEARLLGNLAFMSPEQHRRDESAVTAASDIYSLGGILFWLLTGRHPNGETPENIAASLSTSPEQAEAPSPRAAKISVSRDLDAVCQRALAPVPADRHPAAASLADDLDAWRAFEPVPWIRYSTTRRVGLALRRKPATTAMVILVVTVLVVATVIGIQALQSAKTAAFEAELREEFKSRNEMATQLMFRSSRMRQATGATSFILPYLWTLEWISGSLFLADPADLEGFWKERIEIVRTELADKRAKGEGDSLEALLWETALGLWLVALEEHEEAGPLLEFNEARWRAILDSADPWLRSVHALRLCVDIDAAAAESAGAPLAEPLRARIRAAAEELRAIEAAQGEAYDAAPIRSVILNHIVKAGGGPLLNDPALVEGARTRLNEMAQRLAPSTGDSPAPLKEGS